jgi:SAM-dependent methyltransferase
LLQQSADYYSESLRRCGDGARGMDWKDEASQHLRFAVLTRILDGLAGASVLDVGCGSGALRTFLRERGVDVQYLGIDVSAEMVAACRRRHGQNSARLATTAELLRDGERFDFVVASGTFNVKQGVDARRWGAYVRRSLAEMFGLARCAAAFNIMSSEVDYRRDHLYYLDPRQVPSLARRCGTRYFRLDHAYPLYELTVALFRQPAP